jgi:hypothetical protein
MSRCTTLLVTVFLVAAASVRAQQPAGDPADRLQARWTAIFAEVRRAHGREITGAGLNGTVEEKTAAYREAIERLVADTALRDFFVPDPTLVQERTSEEEARWIARLAQAGVGENGAKSVNAGSTNPIASKLAERSGFSDLVALALDTRNVVAADKSAVSVNLNAVALVGLKSETRSAPAAYRRYDALRRLGGTFTFGGKVPEKEITGFSGVPSAEALFDVFSWDAKVRVVGDRDPRAKRWNDVMLGTLGGLTQISAMVLAFVPANDRQLVASLLNDALGLAVSAVRRRLSKSLQVAVKVAGQHLTTEEGKNKYTFAIIGDQGFGDTDLSFNVLYSTVEDVTLAPGALFAVKTWSGTVGINRVVARNLIVQGRATELSFSANLEAPVDPGSLPIDRKTLWRVIGGITLPWGDAARIPVSLTFTNDPNALKKEKYVTGQVGLSYDFGALKSLFKPQTSGAP